MEIPCEYQFPGDQFSVSWLKTKLSKEGFSSSKESYNIGNGNATETATVIVLDAIVLNDMFA